MGPCGHQTARRATPKIILCATCFGGLVGSVWGAFGNLSSYIIQVYIVTFKELGFFSDMEQCVSSLPLTQACVLTHTSLGNGLAPVKIKTQPFECLSEKYFP